MLLESVNYYNGKLGNRRKRQAILQSHVSIIKARGRVGAPLECRCMASVY